MRYVWVFCFSRYKILTQDRIRHLFNEICSAPKNWTPNQRHVSLNYWILASFTVPCLLETVQACNLPVFIPFVDITLGSP